MDINDIRTWAKNAVTRYPTITWAGALFLVLMAYSAWLAAVTGLEFWTAVGAALGGAVVLAIAGWVFGIVVDGIAPVKGGDE